MKNLSKTFSSLHFPEVHFNPITRDLLLVVITGILIAIAFVSVGFMVVSQF